MMPPKTIAQSIVGEVDWQSDHHGLCKCPGEAAHTNHTRVRDTTVFIDGAPTIFCWHTSCAPYRDEANRKLRRAISSDPLYKPTNIMSGGTSIPRPLVIQKDPEAEVLDRIKTIAESNKQRYLTHYNWDPADMYEASPVVLDDPEQDYQLFLSMFAPTDNLWIGDITDSGSHAQNFKHAEKWKELAGPVGQFTTGASYKEGVVSRSNENVLARIYLVIESDVLSKPEIGAVFALMRDLFRMKLHAVVDTGGKSLHGWFEMPPKGEWLDQLKSFLLPLGCDPATFKPSQPVRIPGAKRKDKMQSLLWFCKGGK